MWGRGNFSGFQNFEVRCIVSFVHIAGQYIGIIWKIMGKKRSNSKSATNSVDLGSRKKKQSYNRSSL